MTKMSAIGASDVREPDPKVGQKPDESRRPRKRSQSLGLVIGGVGFLVLLVVPMDLSGPQQRLAAILFLAVVFWISEAIPLAATSLLALGLAATFGIATPTGKSSGADVVFTSFSSSVVFLLIGGFLIARAIHVHRLDARFALTVLSLPGVAKSSYRVIVAFGLIGLLISGFVSNSATAAMLLPIGMGLVRTINPHMTGKPESAGEGNPGHSRFAVCLMLMISYSAAVGGLLTPIGSPTNLIGISYLEEISGKSITFLEWAAATAPIVAVMFVVLCVVLIAMNRPERRALPDIAYLREQREQLGRLSRGERSTLIVGSLAVLAWLTPSVTKLISGAESPISNGISASLDDGAVAIVAAALLFILPGTERGTKALSWGQAVRIDWGVILLIGAGVVLGTLLSTTGLAKLAGSALGQALGFPSLIVNGAGAGGETDPDLADRGACPARGRDRREGHRRAVVAACRGHRDTDLVSPGSLPGPGRDRGLRGAGRLHRDLGARRLGLLQRLHRLRARVLRGAHRARAGRGERNPSRPALASPGAGCVVRIEHRRARRS